MLQPPVTDLAPWRLDHWITQTGYALSSNEFWNAHKPNAQQTKMLHTVAVTKAILEKVMCK